MSILGPMIGDPRLDSALATHSGPANFLHIMKAESEELCFQIQRLEKIVESP